MRQLVRVHHCAHGLEAALDDLRREDLEDPVPGTRGSSYPNTSCTRFFGRPPDWRAGDEIPNAAQAGAGRITLSVAGLDALHERLAAQGIEHEPVETYSNGVRYAKIPDPDGNAIAFAEPPDGASG